MHKIMMAVAVSLIAVAAQARMDFGKIKSRSGSGSSGSSSDAPTEASARAKAKGADARVIRALDSEGVKYDVRDNGNVTVVWTVSGSGEQKRTHNTVINSGTQEFGGMEIREVWAVAYRGARLPRNILAKYLTDNGMKKIGAWQLIVEDDSKDEALVFCIMIPADSSAKVLRKMSESVAEVADAVEKELDGGDEF